MEVKSAAEALAELRRDLRALALAIANHLPMPAKRVLRKLGIRVVTWTTIDLGPNAEAEIRCWMRGELSPREKLERSRRRALRSERHGPGWCE